MKTIKFISTVLVTIVLCASLLTSISLAQFGGGGFSGTPLWLLDDINLLPIDSTFQIGRENSPIAKGWFTDIDASGVFTLGGTVSGGLDMASSTITNIGNAGTDFTSTGGLTLAGAGPTRLIA